MKKILTAVFILIACFAKAQTYNPSNFTVSNKSYGVAQAVSTDARSWFYDATNFVMRDYQTTTEVNTYLNLAKYRSGHFPVFIHSGGTLSGGGVWIGGTTLVYWYKDSTGNANLVRWFTDSVNVSGFLLATNNLSDLQSIATAKTNLVLNNVDNTSDATKNAASVTLTNHTISGSNNTLTNIGNSSLTNSSIGLTLTASGNDVSIPVSPAALGTNNTINIPSASAAARGVLTSANWTLFNGKVDSTSVSTDSVYDWHNGSKVFRYIVPPKSWSINGNSGLTQGVNFLGNIDSVGVDIRSDDTIVARFGYTGLTIFGHKGTLPLEILKFPVTGQIGVPSIQIQDSTGASLLDITNNVKYNIFIGTGAGSGVVGTPGADPFATGNNNIGIGSVAARGAPFSAPGATGISNVAIGGSCLALNTSGSSNTAIGTDALFVNTIGNDNTAIGQAAMAFNISGNFNMALGHDALRQNSTGSFNLGVGEGALQNNQTGVNNVALGHFSLAYGPEGTQQSLSRNIGVGYFSGFSLSLIGSNNIIIGDSSMVVGSLGDNSVFVGSNQFTTSTTTNSTLIGGGMSIGVGNVAALGRSDQNVILGRTAVNSDAGQKLQVSGNMALFGSSNTTQELIKLPASQSYANPFFVTQNSTGVTVFAINNIDTTNTYIGAKVGLTSTTATGNLAVGGPGLFVPTMSSVTTGGANTAIGSGAMGSTTTGMLNTAVGNNSLVFNVTGTMNTAIGQASLAGITSGINNIGVGENSIHAGNVSSTIAIGTQVMNNSTTGNADIFIGTGSVEAVLAGDSNIVIGYHTHQTDTLGNNNITIGRNTTSLGTQSNTMLLGNAIFTNVSNIVGIGRADQNIILGTTAITVDNGGRLQLPAGTATAGTGPLKFLSGTNLTVVENGSMEYDGNHLYFTDGTPTRGIIQHTNSVISAAGTVSMSIKVSDYIASGTTSTWTLPALSGNSNVKFYIKNRGSGNLTINSNAGGNDIYTTSAVNTITVAAGAAVILFNDGTFYNQE